MAGISFEEVRHDRRRARSFGSRSGRGSVSRLVAFAVSCLLELEELMFITEQGMILRTRAQGISLIGRATQGVRLIDLDEGDRTVAVARLEDQGSIDEPAPDSTEETGSDTTPT